MEFNNLKRYSQLNGGSSDKQIVGVLIKGKSKYIASTYIRLLSAFDNFNDDNFDFYIIDDLEIDGFRKDLLDDDCKLDLVIVQRDVIDLEFSKLLVKVCRLYGIKLIYEIDDDLVNMDTTQPDFKRYVEKINVVRYLAENASAVTVTTDSLKYSLSGFNNNIEIIPNVLTDSWVLNENFKSNDGETIKIGYMGTTTHANDLKLIEKAISNVRDDYPDKNIIFEMVGGSDNNLEGFQRVNIPFDKRHYPDFVSWIQNAIEWDIAIAPLADNNNINESKSELKYLEYTALNVPGIYSDVGPYGKCIVHGTNGLLVKTNSAEEWEKNMKKLIESESLREKIHKNAWKDVLKNYTVDNLVTNWEIFLNKSKRNKNSTLYSLIKKYSDEKVGMEFNEFLMGESKAIIENSKLFDEKYYLSKYPDVKESDLSPIDHYLTFGAEEYCNPCEAFNTEEYVRKNPFVKELGINPLVHHVLYDDSSDDYPIIGSTDTSRNIEIMKKSKIFDPDWYLINNPDVKNADVDPYFHYAYYGYRENHREPFPNFSSSFYRNAYLNNSNTWNPLTHYILIGKERGYEINSWGFADKYGGAEVDRILDKLDNKTSIVVPIYNYSDIVINSIKLVLAKTEGFELKLIIGPDLDDSYSQFFNQLPKSCNAEIIIADYKDFPKKIEEVMFACLNDVVLLNSYTTVTGNWLSRLIAKAYSDENIGMVSPISNFIADLYNNSRTNYNLTIEGISTLLKKSSIFSGLDSRFADAFCVYIKKDALGNLKSIGEIDHDFEENDAFFDVPKGITHVVDDSVFIYHDSRFFSDNSDKLSDAKGNFSDRLKINKFLRSPQIKNIESKLDAAVRDRNDISLSNRILYVLEESKLHLAADFLNYYNRLHYDCYFLTCADDFFKLWKGGSVIHTWNVKNIRFDKNFKCEYLREIYFNVLFTLNINILQINDFGLNSFDLFDVSNSLGIPIVFNGTFSDIDNAFNENSCMVGDDVDFDVIYDNWHVELSEYLKQLIIIHPDEDSLSVFADKFGNIGDNRVIHTPALNKRLTGLDEGMSDNIRILIPGNLSEDEFNLMKAIKKKDASDLLEMHFLGDVPNHDESVGVNRGTFSRDGLLSEMDEFNPHSVILLNPSPEMFKVIDVCKSCRIPLIFDEISLRDFIDELEIDDCIDFKDIDQSYNRLLEFHDFDNYYPVIKKLYYDDMCLKKDIIKYDAELEGIYLPIGNVFSKSLIKENPLSDRNKEKTVNFSDFEGFLANSYVSPILYAPFVEEEKRCFAVMDNIAKYLMKNASSNKDLVSIVMPVYNRESIVKKSIHSVLNQTYENFELIVVDDKSSDGTRDVLKGIDDERVKLIFLDSNSGVSVARNIGLKNCSGKYIFYLDSDNEWDSRYLEAMVGAFIELPDADALYSGQFLYDDYDEPPFAMRFGSLNKSLLSNGNYIDLNCFAHTKRAYDEIGGFDESLYRLVDWDLILRFCNNFKVYSVPVVLSKYYMGVTDNSISAANERSIEKKLGYKNLTRTVQHINDSKKVIDYTLDKKVNIVIPSFESLNDLQECINAVLAFENDKIRIIVVDNNSSKPVRYYLDSLKSDGLIELIQNDINYGFTYAVNQGIEISDDDSDILLLNNDAILMEGSIEAMQKCAYEQEDCGIVVPQQVLPGGTPTMNVHVPYASAGFDCDVNPSAHHKNIVNMRNFHDGEILELSFAPFFCTYIKRDVLDDSFGLDAELGRHFRSDRIFSEYVRHVMNKKIFHVSDAVVYHKLQRATQSLKKNEDKYDMMLFKNRWEKDLAKELGFKQPEWDRD
ncbi:glycosyltransferase [Methanobrevibacter sp.]|uniref:glycosyltransferase n=1 Tax=Methanobrevibacter sp. TaxID=66852 RepID=UPI00388F157E